MDDDKRDDAPAYAVPTARQRRRRFSAVQKRQMVEETLTGETSVSQVARRYDVNANQLFKWRKQYREGRLAASGGADECADLLPVVVDKPQGSRADGALEIDLGNGCRLTVSGSVDPGALRIALAALR